MRRQQIDECCPLASLPPVLTSTAAAPTLPQARQSSTSVPLMTTARSTRPTPTSTVSWMQATAGDMAGGRPQLLHGCQHASLQPGSITFPLPLPSRSPEQAFPLGRGWPVREEALSCFCLDAAVAAGDLEGLRLSAPGAGGRHCLFCLALLANVCPTKRVRVNCSTGRWTEHGKGIHATPNLSLTVPARISCTLTFSPYFSLIIMRSAAFLVLALACTAAAKQITIDWSKAGASNLQSPLTVVLYTDGVVRSIFGTVVANTGDASSDFNSLDALAIFCGRLRSMVDA